jgi:NADPH:quinone reductase-like Zn-dependent oxidoreductase
MAPGLNNSAFKAQQGYAPGDAVIGTCGLGAYAEFLAVKPATHVRKPSNLSFEEATSVPPKLRGRDSSPTVTWKRDKRS